MTKRAAETIYVMRGGSRVEWWQWVELGWPETSLVSTLAAAGARVSSEPRLRGTARRVARCVRLLETW